MSSLRLHGYWRSTATYRVRIALALKGLNYDAIPHDLRHGEQRSASYLALAPHGLVPTLETDQGVIAQSLAILEWLEERYPEPPLLPADLPSRAAVRTMACLVACDIHPLNNLRVLAVLRGEFGASQGQIDRWIGRWIVDGFSALEILVSRSGGAFCFGDAPGLADCCLVPQVYSARRFSVDLTLFPRIVEIDARMTALPAVAAAHPRAQADTDSA